MEIQLSSMLESASITSCFPTGSNVDPPTFAALPPLAPDVAYELVLALEFGITAIGGPGEATKLVTLPILLRAEADTCPAVADDGSIVPAIRGAVREKGDVCV